LAECHDDEACVEKRKAVVRKIRYGNGILLKLTVCSYYPEEESGKIISTILAELRRRELSHVTLTVTGGLGNFADAPLLSVSIPNTPTIFYARVKQDMISRIITEHIEQNTVVREWVLGQFSDDEQKLLDSVPVIQYLDFFRAQNLRVMRRCGLIEPDNLDEFFLEGGFLAFAKALNRMEPDEVVNLVGACSLRGRGGSGESYVVTKWLRILSQESDEDLPSEQPSPHIPKYLICNAHEGYAMSIKDRNLLESDPFALIEGMLLTAYAVRATEGIIYINPTYHLAIKRLQNALELARQHNYLGKEILGTSFSFDIEIRRAPAGYLAGEETAIVSYLEGDIGTRPVPPYLEETGLWGHPTLIHNVETFVNIALLVEHDFSWFTSTGVADNPGTKCLTLTGAVKQPGIIEVPLGTPIHDIIFEIGGGAHDDRPIKAVHIGGPLGGYLPPEQLETPYENEALEALGLRLGAGTIEVLDHSVCIVDRVRQHFQMTLHELCGQCTAGREGIYQLSALLHALCEGQNLPGCQLKTPDYQRVFADLCTYIQCASLCIYCNYATSSLMTSLRYFQKEYEEHLQKRCRAGVCF
jgi:NADH-quinone oxidoreductase subunit F